ncbi:Protein of unknown function DUF1800 [Catenulispora acidiphila DSM 44928]|uniref:DUF1800 domain-containing protein n=1 Tax=Catenulispora acidiphila (strain DSM 44928 / JCM 14897 / NBRC 102108 / NRRL B-24433 / ID139908) TaxID=479433 RepID=C7QCZ9_CATAD|nr:DUF1800 domain-containing protein [Catenulispora acidiphila]ACU70709.1 Protein of unknown function DUF1800 [Catenulispora acidiphila DSM 44928]
MSIDQNRSAIAHLLRRAGFGASGAEIDAAVQAGYEATVSALLAPAGADPGVAATPAPNFPAAKADKADKAAKKIDAQSDYQMVEWWLARMTAVTQPLAEKRTFFLHGHFATSIQKVKSPGFMVQQNQTLRTLGGGDFGVLAHAMVRDPAMMLWLDSAGNTLKAPNENLARELMELFTLGVGNYTEDDVRAGARALTGWRLDADGKASLVPRLHDGTPKTILGKTADFDDTSFVDWILQQPGSPKFVTGRFWDRFGMPGPIPADVSGRLLAAYGPNRNVTALLRALFLDPVFRGPQARNALVKQPTEYIVGVLRALRIKIDAAAKDTKDSQALRTALNGLGQTPFYPPNVGGWPEGTAWLTTAAAQTRFAFAEWAVAKGDLSQVENSSPGQRIAAVAHLLGVDAFSDRSTAALNEVVADPKQLVTLALLAPEYLAN